MISHWLRSNGLWQKTFDPLSLIRDCRKMGHGVKFRSIPRSSIEERCCAPAKGSFAQVPHPAARRPFGKLRAGSLPTKSAKVVADSFITSPDIGRGREAEGRQA